MCVCVCACACSLTVRERIGTSPVVEVFRIDLVVLPVLPDVLAFFVSAEGLAHVEGVFAGFAARRVVAVVVDYAPEDAVSGVPGGALAEGECV